MREATFGSIIRVRNTKSAIEAIIALHASGLGKLQTAMDKRLFKLDEKFGWTLDDIRAVSKLKCYEQLIIDGVKLAKQLQAVQDGINAETAPVAKPVAKPAAKPAAKPVKRAGRKANKRAAQVKAAKVSGAQALAVHRAQYAHQSVKAAPANQSPASTCLKPDPKVELQAHIAQLLEDAKAVARKRKPTSIDEAQAQLDRDVAAVLSMLG